MVHDRRPLLLSSTCGINVLPLLMSKKEPAMIDLRPEYLVDANSQRKAVVLTMAEWSEILETLEELDDIRAYDAAKAQKDEAMPFEMALHEKSSDYSS